MKEELNKLAEAMYNVNRNISFHYVALADKKTVQEKDRMLRELNKFIGEWIKQIRELGEELEGQ